MMATIITVPEDLDADHVARAAREALTMPDDSTWFDDRWFTTHGCVWAWADQTGDILAESNYHAALAELQGAVAWDESGASEARGDDVVEASAGHWGFGSLRHLFVRVYTDDTESQYTPAFLQAVRLAKRASDSGVLDESDYCERESAAFMEDMNDAIDDAARNYPDDTPAEIQAFAFLLMRDDDGRIADSYPEADWHQVAEAYARVRAEHFQRLAEWYAAPYVPPGQDPLPGM